MLNSIRIKPQHFTSSNFSSSTLFLFEIEKQIKILFTEVQFQQDVLSFTKIEDMFLQLNDLEKYFNQCENYSKIMDKQIQSYKQKIAVIKMYLEV